MSAKPKSKLPPDPTVECPILVRPDRVLLFGIRKFIQGPWKSRLVDAVTRAHKCFENALFLSKLILLERFDKCLAANDGAFDHSVATSFTTGLKLDDQYFKHLLTVVSCEDPLTRRGRPFSLESKVKIQSYMETYQHHSTRLPPKVDGSNLSHIFKYLAIQMATAYSNNVQHFEKYLKSFIRYKLEAYFVYAHQVDSIFDLPKGVRPFITKLGSSMIRAILWKSDEAEHKQVVIEDDSNLQDYVDNITACVRMYFIPPGVEPEKISVGIEEDPIRFIPYMIYLNRISERMMKKLKSPLPIRSHHIPGSITIDTAALIDIMLKTDNDVTQLSTFLAVQHNMSGITKKSHFFNLSTPEFKSHIWKFFTNVNDFSTYERKIGGNLVFNNMITTNGYKVGINYTNLDNYHHDKFTRGINVVGEDVMEKRRRLKAKEIEFTYVKNLSPERREELQSDKFINLYCDPGKANILCIGTGTTTNTTNGVTGDQKVKSSPVINYTAVQHRFQTGQTRNKKELKSILSSTVSGSDLTYRTIIEHGGGMVKISEMSDFELTDLLV